MSSFLISLFSNYCSINSYLLSQRFARERGLLFLQIPLFRDSECFLSTCLPQVMRVMNFNLACPEHFRFHSNTLSIKPFFQSRHPQIVGHNALNLFVCSLLPGPHRFQFERKTSAAFRSVRGSTWPISLDLGHSSCLLGSSFGFPIETLPEDLKANWLSYKVTSESEVEISSDPFYRSKSKFLLNLNWCMNFLKIDTSWSVDH